MLKAPPVKGYVRVVAVGLQLGIRVPQREQLIAGWFRAATSPATLCSCWILAVIARGKFREAAGGLLWGERSGLTRGRIDGRLQDGMYVSSCG